MMTALSSHPAPAQAGSGKGSNPAGDRNPTAAEGVEATAGDRSFDLSLRLLTVLVLVALIGSVGLLAYRLISPHFYEPDAGSVTITTNRPKPAPAKDSAGPDKGDEVLMDPGHVFRCEEQGRVSFSDRACTQGAAAAPAAAPGSGH